MDLWLCIILLIAAAAGLILAAKFLPKNAPLRRFLMLGCVIFGAMILLYTCLQVMLLGPAQSESGSNRITSPMVSQEEDLPEAVYLSLDDLTYQNGRYYLTATTIAEDLTVIASRTFLLNESLTASMLPGWDPQGKRYDFFTAKDFSTYWKYSQEQGFPVTGSICRFQYAGDHIVLLNEVDPTGEKLFQ